MENEQLRKWAKLYILVYWGQVVLVMIGAALESNLSRESMCLLEWRVIRILQR